MGESALEMKEREPLSGLVERVTVHSGETGFCVLRVKVRGQRDLVTVLGKNLSRSPEIWAVSIVTPYFHRKNWLDRYPRPNLAVRWPWNIWEANP